ncbi:MAG TPA: CDP-diacylglycerol--glycerol-3-phosphate 3-phosphatidyltransferase [Thermoanaerobaculia bacterium]|jgi:CDP-diacylglycerol--glycerol-3-phosphate 3-phosphatidyltransferase|nr:CDP-diacylglycerol--glycerol-3-phosphate 3-phosphatidyltransferase [Thermoanaerobaculia bacterium]
MRLPRHLPNLLSLFRILLVPLLVVVLLTKFEGREFVGLGVFLLASLTDFLDGFIARRFGMETRLGRLLDPAADKILTAAAFISLVELNPGLVPAWMVVAIIARELAVDALRSVAAAERVVIGASFAGKIKTTSQIISISLLIFYNQLGEFSHLAPLSLWLSLLVTIYSGIEYFVRYGRLILADEVEPAA